MFSNLNYLGMAANQTLRWIAAGLLLIAAGLAIALPFVSATVLTLAIGGVAISAGIAQILRIVRFRLESRVTQEGATRQ
jgi:uncharacterized membrane protein HdeD (DUF308 family)